MSEPTTADWTTAVFTWQETTPDAAAVANHMVAVGNAEQDRLIGFLGANEVSRRIRLFDVADREHESKGKRWHSHQKKFRRDGLFLFSSPAIT